MGYKDQLQPATFRAVPFKVDSSEYSAGRRSAEHVYPGRDFPFVEDLGASVVRFRVTGYVIGDDYLAQRDRLIAALESPGVRHRVLEPGGKLVHPYYGIRTVWCSKYTVSESPGTGRMARFIMDFVEIGEQVFPIRSRSPQGAADDQATALQTAAQAALTEDLATTGAVQEVREATAAVLRQAGATIKALDVFSGPAQQASELAQLVDALIDDAAQLATSPAALATAVKQAFDKVLDAVESAEDSLYVYETLFDVEPTLQPTTASSGSNLLAANANATATGDFVHVHAIAGAIRAAVRTSFDSRGEAIATRDRLSEAIDQLELTASDGVLVELGRLREVLVGQIPGDLSDLPRLESIVKTGSPSVLALAYELYDDVDRGDEIAARNALRHPGFIPGGQPIEVLIDA